MQKRKDMRAKANKRNVYESGVLSSMEKKLGVSGGGGEMVSRDDAMVASSSSLMKGLGIEGGKVGGGGGSVGGGEESKGESGDPFTLGGSSMKLQPAKDKVSKRQGGANDDNEGEATSDDYEAWQIQR